MAGFVVRNRFSNRGGANQQYMGDWLRMSRGNPRPESAATPRQGPPDPADSPAQPVFRSPAQPVFRAPAPTGGPGFADNPLQGLLIMGGQEVASKNPNYRIVDFNGNQYFFSPTGVLVGQSANTGQTGRTVTTAPPTGGATAPTATRAVQDAAKTGTVIGGGEATAPEFLSLTPEQVAAINGDPVLQSLVPQLVAMEQAGTATLSAGPDSGATPADAAAALAPTQPSGGAAFDPGTTTTAAPTDTTQPSGGATFDAGTTTTPTAPTGADVGPPTGGSPALFADANGNMVTLEQLLAQPAPTTTAYDQPQLTSGTTTTPDGFVAPPVDMATVPVYDTTAIDPGMLTTPLDAVDSTLVAPPPIDPNTVGFSQ